MSKKIVKPMEVKLRSKMSHWPKIPHRYDHVSENHISEIRVSENFISERYL